jgi:acyl-CoA thioesterase
MKKKTDYHHKLSKLVRQLSEDDARSYFEHLSKLAPSAGEKTDFWSGLMGLKWLQKGQGSSRCEVEVTPALLNPYGSLSGGVLFAMVDYGMGAALSSLLAEDERSATIEIKLNFLAAVSSGRVIADTTVVHPGKKIAYMETRIKNEDGRLIVVASGSYYRFNIDSG